MAALKTRYMVVGIGQKSYSFWKFCALTINLAIGFIQEPTGMHWLGYNDAVPNSGKFSKVIFLKMANHFQKYFFEFL